MAADINARPQLCHGAKRMRRYCCGMLWLVVGLLSLIAAFNLLVDPVGVYAPTSLQGFAPLRFTLFSRTARAELARRGPWDMVVLGTSRAKAGFLPNHPLFSSNRVCNLAVDAAYAYETAAILDYVRARQNLRRVLLFLDFSMFMGDVLYKSDFLESRLNPDHSAFEYHCKHLLGEEVTALSWTFTKNRLHGRGATRGDTNGFYMHWLPNKLSQREVIHNILRSQAKGHALGVISPEQLKSFRTIIRACRENRLELTLAINPVHALDLELFYAAETWERFEHWKRDLVRTLAEEDTTGTIKLWDFSGYSSFTTEEIPPDNVTKTRMKYYFEASHFTPVLGSLMLDRMFSSASDDFGTALSPKNIEAHLRSIREQRVLYARAHPAEVALIEQIIKNEGFGRLAPAKERAAR